MIRRRKKKRTGDAVALFPFLAVLICTMGSLIVLLVVLVQQARLQAEESSADAIAEHQQQLDQLQQRKAEQDALLQRLTPLRDAIREKLNDQQAALAHLEEHIERLEKRWKQLLAQAQAMNDADADSSDQVLIDEQRALIEEQIEATREEIERLKRELAGRKPSFAIIPYQGRNGTRRRPIFIECDGETLTLQPEGVTMTLADFEGPIGVGPGNPLEAALRTIREHYAELGGEPYPLIVVRPTGATAYGAARAAMTGWDDEFGYELVGADKELKFGPPDAMLAAKLNETVKRARSRQALLAAAMPGGFQGGPARYIVKRRGGVERVGGPPPTPGSRGMQADGNAEEHNADQPGGDADQKAENPGASQGGAAAIANSKGVNWGLPGSTGNAQGFTRPVRVVLQTDKLMIMPPRGRYFAPIVTQLSQPVSKDDSLRFVTKLWNHMESWGIAAQGGYWIPVMSVEVGPGADAQFDRFVRLMQSSGIQINRKIR